MWQQALMTVCSRHEDESPEWGVFDCCQFVREYVHELAGVDYGGDLKYSTEDEAMALIARHGTLVDLLASILGPPKPEPDQGDVVVAQLGEGYGAGVWGGQWVIGVLPDKGLCRYRLPVVAAWTCLK